MKVDQRIEYLQMKLHAGLKSETKTFSDLSQLKCCGLYIIYTENKIIYVGKTTRKGKTRLREMISDFRSHTFNRKLLKERLENKLKRNITAFRNTIKAELIAQEIITETEFITEQNFVNNFIKGELKFKFIEEEQDLTALEHFAIAVLQPSYND